MTWDFWPFNRKPKEEDEATAEFKRQIAASKARTDDLEAVAERLRRNQENIHNRAKELIGEENVIGRPAFKSSPR